MMMTGRRTGAVMLCVYKIALMQLVQGIPSELSTSALHHHGANQKFTDSCRSSPAGPGSRIAVGPAFSVCRSCRSANVEGAIKVRYAKRTLKALCSGSSGVGRLGYGSKKTKKI